MRVVALFLHFFAVFQRSDVLFTSCSQFNSSSLVSEIPHVSGGCIFYEDLKWYDDLRSWRLTTDSITFSYVYILRLHGSCSCSSKNLG